jgi:hypothetical protein
MDEARTTNLGLTSSVLGRMVAFTPTSVRAISAAIFPIAELS